MSSSDPTGFGYYDSLETGHLSPATYHDVQIEGKMPMVTVLVILGAVALVAGMVRYARRYSRGETVSDTDDPYGWDSPDTSSSD